MRPTAQHNASRSAMTERSSSVVRRIARYAAISAALWLVVLAIAWWYLARVNAREVAVAALPITNADSIGLPLVALGLWLAIALAALNALLAVLLILRRRRRS